MRSSVKGERLMEKKQKHLLVISLKTATVEKLKREQQLPWIIQKAEQKISDDRTFFYIPEDFFDLAKHLLDHLGVKYVSTF